MRLANNPSCDLALVIKALYGPAFDPIEYVAMKFLSEKNCTSILAKRADDHCVLSVYFTCTQLASEGEHIFNQPNGLFYWVSMSDICALAKTSYFWSRFIIRTHQSLKLNSNDILFVGATIR